MTLKYWLLFCSFLSLNTTYSNQQPTQPVIGIQVVALLVALQCKVVFEPLKKLPEYHPMQEQQDQLNAALKIAEKEFGVSIIADKNTDTVVKRFDPELYQAIYYVTYTELHELNVQWSIDWDKLCHEQLELNRFIKFFTSVLEKVRNKAAASTDSEKKEALSMVANCLTMDLSHFKAVIEKIDQRHTC